MNISDFSKEYEGVAELFSLLAQPARLEILSLIGEHEVCVCHLMASLGYRQAYISQQLMGLRKAGFVKTRRQGRLIYYSLTDRRLLQVIQTVAGLNNLSLPEIGLADIENCPVLPAPTQS